MILTVASFKGGVAKTTTAVNLANYLAGDGKTLLVDGDLNRSATVWASRGRLPFTVVSEVEAALYAPHFKHIVFDTKARPEYEDLKALAMGCHLLIVPCTPDRMSIDALLTTVKQIQKFDQVRFRVLLTMVPPKPSRFGALARASLEAAGLPLFRHSIPRQARFQHWVNKGTIDRSLDYEAVAEEINALVDHLSAEVQHRINAETDKKSLPPVGNRISDIAARLRQRVNA